MTSCRAQIILNVHAHLSKNEVIGYLAGRFSTAADGQAGKLLQSHFCSSFNLEGLSLQFNFFGETATQRGNVPGLSSRNFGNHPKQRIRHCGMVSLSPRLQLRPKRYRHFESQTIASVVCEERKTNDSTDNKPLHDIGASSKFRTDIPHWRRRQTIQTEFRVVGAACATQKFVPRLAGPCDEV